jgi:hypothetical protein
VFDCLYREWWPLQGRKDQMAWLAARETGIAHIRPAEVQDDAASTTRGLPRKCLFICLFDSHN